MYFTHAKPSHAVTRIYDFHFVDGPTLLVEKDIFGAEREPAAVSMCRHTHSRDTSARSPAFKCDTIAKLLLHPSQNFTVGVFQNHFVFEKKPTNHE